ncbi:MAG: hypothetical protein KGI50_06135 [Patescibacteria group bacterium]|nr:hypothetical protein [Patescibacteria group bacterium]MDE2439079.1 hypothetical protein [Patescibacteria group bacterium]
MPRETIVQCSQCGDSKNSRTNHWVIGKWDQSVFDPTIELFSWSEELSIELAHQIKMGDAFEVCPKPGCLSAVVSKILFHKVAPVPRMEPFFLRNYAQKLELRDGQKE